MDPQVFQRETDPISGRKGSAGSGKSLGLAARAARLAEEGQDVLVVTYNATLPHYLRDLAGRHACRPTPSSTPALAPDKQKCIRPKKGSHFAADFVGPIGTSLRTG